MRKEHTRDAPNVDDTPVVAVADDDVALLIDERVAILLLETLLLLSLKTILATSDILLYSIKGRADSRLLCSVKHRNALPWSLPAFLELHKLLRKLALHKCEIEGRARVLSGVLLLVIELCCALCCVPTDRTVCHNKETYYH
jgi:hypothetical protein